MTPAHRRIMGLVAGVVLLAGCGGSDEPDDDTGASTGGGLPTAGGLPADEGVIPYDEAAVGTDPEATLRAWLEYVAEGDLESACELSSSTMIFAERGESQMVERDAPVVEAPQRFMDYCPIAKETPFGSKVWPDDVSSARASEVASTETYTSGNANPELPNIEATTLVLTDGGEYRVQRFGDRLYVSIGTLWKAGE